MKALYGLVIFSCFISCAEEKQPQAHITTPSVRAIESTPTVGLKILGIVQDAGRPHIGCAKDCCAEEHLPEQKQHVVSLGLWDREENRSFLLEATPDVASQLHDLSDQQNASKFKLPDGIFITHAHIGHYSGLMYLGKEALGAKRQAVYAMPQMREFLSHNGPWDQLVEQENIVLKPLEADRELVLTKRLSITPFQVPHRDEYSETVGFLIRGPQKSVLFIPDINKWEVWDRSIVALIAEVDLAYIDGSFYNGNELPHRDMADIPHPFVVESMALFDALSDTEKNKIHFIHLNHTNPLLDTESEMFQFVQKKGYRIAKQGTIVSL